MLTNPLVLVRTALDPATKVGKLRAQGAVQVVDIATATGERVTLAVNRTSHLPAWVSWTEHNENLGDVTLRTAFTGYLPVKGVLLPMGYNTTMNFRNVIQNKIYVDKNAVDEPIDDLTAPADVRSAPAPAAPAPPVAQASQVARGVWLLHGPGGGVGPAPVEDSGRGTAQGGGFGGGGANSVLFEFADHLTLFEMPSSQAWARALIERAKATVPGKPLTEVIVSHHHFDHTGGIRQAIADGLTVIAHKGTEGLFREIAARKGTIGSDAIGATPKPLKFKAVDDRLVLKDGSMEVDIYHSISNSHMAEGVFAYVPSDRLLVQGDFFDVGWDLYFWQNTYRDNIKYRNLEVDRDVPIHGRVLPLPQVFQDIERMTQAAERVCARASAIGVFLPGCPIKKPSSIVATSSQ
jgi:hypothetical protein